MGLGICTITSDIEPLAELLQGACIKIAPDEYQEGTLMAMLEHLVDNPEFRQQIGNNGREFVARHHNIDDVAQRYVGWIETACKT
jgi:glycosyltransferase involved in cell wall biosynthesis